MASKHRFLTIWLRVILLFGLITSVSITSPQLVLAQGISFPAQINKSFTPINIVAGEISRLSITIYNPNPFELIDAAFLDDLEYIQPGILIADPVNLTNSCGGAATANSGGTTVSLSGGSVPPQVGATAGECTITLDVTSITPGNLIDTIQTGALTATCDPLAYPATCPDNAEISNTTPASATLRVGAVQPPSLSKAFAPNTVWVGQVSVLSITIRNNDLNNALTETTLPDNLPDDVYLADPPLPANSLTGCGTSASIDAVAGGSSVTLNNATIAPNTSCVVRANVISVVPNRYTNTIPARSIQTRQGVTNASAASAPLNVQAVGVSKSFSPSTLQAGGISLLTIRLQNPTTSPYTAVYIQDTLPGTVLTVVDGSAVSYCGGTVTTTLPRTVTLTGGTIPAGTILVPGQCTITVQVTSPSSASAATYTNRILANTMQTDQGVTNILDATANISIYASGTGIGGSSGKSFSPTSMNAGQNTRLRIDIYAPADTNLNNFAITDNLPANVTVSNSSPAAVSGCGTGYVLSAPTGATSISLTNGTILAGARCRIDVYVTSSTTGVHQNIIYPSNITNNENRTTAGNLTANLTVLGTSDLSVSKSFYPGTVNPNGLSTLTIVLQNNNTSMLVDVSLLDTLPGSTTNGVVIAPVPNASTTCTGGSVAVTAGQQSIQMTGGIIPAQVEGVPGICTIIVDVQGKGSNATRTNTIYTYNVSGTILDSGVVINPIRNATAPLVIANLTVGVVKGFNPLIVTGGSASTLSVQLVNANNAPLTGIAFTDNMPGGMTIANPANLNVGTCGGVLIGNPGDSSFSFSGGSLAAATSCTVTLSATMNANGNLTNEILANAVTTFNGATNPQKAEATLTNLPGASVSKFFGPNTIRSDSGEYSTLTITILNTGNVPITGMGVFDNLPNGLTIAPPPAPDPVTLCGGTLTADPNTQLIQLSDASLAASASCTITVSVTGNAIGDYRNCIPVGALTNNENVRNTQEACDTLYIHGEPLGIKEVIAGGSTFLNWTVMWINNAFPDPVLASASDDIPENTTFISSGPSSGFDVPPGAPPGSVNTGVACTENSPTTQTTACYYEGPTANYPRGRIVWEGTLGPDIGITDPNLAVNKITISFSTNIELSLQQAQNTAFLDCDLNLNGTIEDGERQVASAAAAWKRNKKTSGLPSELPGTGFRPGSRTLLPRQPQSRMYSDLGSLWLEIPSLGVNATILGIPVADRAWDVSWLGDRIGWLEGTAFPTWSGNSVLTGHVYDANGQPGPFINLHRLHWGDSIIIHAWGQEYHYKVRSVQTKVSAGDTRALQHEEYPWLTLTTCQGYDERSDSYRWRVVVRAVQVRVD
jgi:LPXTG-site transpeptidase (sortase) family protein